MNAPQRLTGEHWWDADRLQHVEDRPRFCPGCGTAFAEEAFAVEYWEADRRVYHSWCRACGWTGDIALVHRMIGPEAAEGEG